MTDDLKRALALAGQGGLATDFTPVAAPEAAALCAALYGIEGDFKRLETEKDDTYLITTGAGRFILKIANPDETGAELDLQLAALRHLERKGFSLPAPRVVPTRTGAMIAPQPGSGRMVRLLSFVEGTPLDHLRYGDGGRYQIGRALAQLRLAFADFTHPAQGRQLVWDVQHVMTLRPLLTQIALTPGEIALAERSFARLATIAPRIPALPRQVLHNDFYASNIVGDPAAPEFVTGVIDFGDIVETAVAIDLSTAVTGQIARDFGPGEDIFAPARPVVTGYTDHAPLSAEELAMVPHLVMARVLVRAVMTQWRAALMPANAPYILRNAGPSWAQLDWFLARDPREIEHLLGPETLSRSPA